MLKGLYNIFCFNFSGVALFGSKVDITGIFLRSYNSSNLAFEMESDIDGSDLILNASERLGVNDFTIIILSVSIELSFFWA